MTKIRGCKYCARTFATRIAQLMKAFNMTHSEATNDLMFNGHFINKPEHKFKYEWVCDICMKVGKHEVQNSE